MNKYIIQCGHTTQYVAVENHSAQWSAFENLQSAFGKVRNALIITLKFYLFINSIFHS